MPCLFSPVVLESALHRKHRATLAAGDICVCKKTARLTAPKTKVLRLSLAAEYAPFYAAINIAKQSTELQFPAWEYRPSYLPDPLVMHIAEAEVEEPM
jgi:hypothetical protein